MRFALFWPDFLHSKEWVVWRFETKSTILKSPPDDRVKFSFSYFKILNTEEMLWGQINLYPKICFVSDQASHSIFFICTCNHEVVFFYDTPSLVIICYCASNIFSFGNEKRNTSLLISCYITNVYYLHLPFISTSIYKCQHYDYILHFAWNC